MTSSRPFSSSPPPVPTPVPRGLLVAGAGSGSGKTLATLALLSGLKARGLDVLPYKCGPDFIDPRHHERVALTPSRNLDLHFTPPDRLRKDFDRELSGRAGAVVEGVMGLFDGLSGGRSTFDLARVLGLPVVLVLSARGMAETAAALVRGLVSFREGVAFAGVIATRTGSPRHGEMIARALEEEGLPPLLGVLPRDSHLELPERHLGLSAPGEEGEERERLFLEALLAHAQRFAWERILPFFSLPSSVSPLSTSVPISAASSAPAPRSPEAGNSFVGERLGSSPEGEGGGGSRGPWGAFLGSLRERVVPPLPGESPGDPSSLPRPLSGALPGSERDGEGREEAGLGGIEKTVPESLKEATKEEGPERGQEQELESGRSSDRGRGAMVESPGKGEGGGRRDFVPRPPRLAVALDRAFWFYYHENWESLREEGIEIVFFSPLDNTRLPPGTSGLYFGGGYPEIFARELTQNRSMVEEVRDFCLSGRPVYAECGGMLYLTRGPVEDPARQASEGASDEGGKPQGRSSGKYSGAPGRPIGNSPGSFQAGGGEGRGAQGGNVGGLFAGLLSGSLPSAPRERESGESLARVPVSPEGMVGILPVRYRMGERLRRLGYAEVTAASGLFAGVPGSLRGHLFHYTTLVEETEGERDPRAEGTPEGREGLTSGSLPGGGEPSAPSHRLAPSPAAFLNRTEPAFRHRTDGRPEGFAQGGVVASYMHAFFPTNPLYAARLAERLRS